MRSTITEHEVRRIRELRETGHTYTEIGRALNRAPSTVRYSMVPSERSACARRQRRRSARLALGKRIEKQKELLRMEGINPRTKELLAQREKDGPTLAKQFLTDFYNALTRELVS